MEKKGLKKGQDISSRAIGLKKSEYIIKTVNQKDREDLEKEGWEFVPSKLKKSFRMRKAKQHDVCFEDKVWSIFAKMGFEYLNENRNFKIEYQEGLTKQIDVFAADKEAIIIVECKSCETRKKVSYQQEIDAFIGIKDKLRIAVRELISKNAKVAFIFGTHNSILNLPDRTRLKEESIHHFTQDDFEYYGDITDHLGSAAKFQFYGKLFEGQKVPELLNRVPAIKGKMSSGDTCYSFSVSPDFLLKIGFILHRTESNRETSQAYQRLVKKPRLKDIAKYIDQGGYFPNSVIINIATKSNKPLNFKEAEKIEHDSSTQYGILHLPQTYRSVFIIDGQHRLYGYSKTKSQSNHTIPVVAFHNMKDEEQANIFVKINQTQKSVPANLLASIMADFNWGSDNEKLAINALKTRLFIELNAQDSSPFYKRIVIAEEKQSDVRCLTLKTILDWGVNKTNFFGIIKNEKLIKHGHLTDVTYKKTLIKALEFFNICFGKVQEDLKNQWDVGRDEGGFIAMNIGVSALIRIFDSIVDFLEKFKNVCPQEKSGEELAFLVAEYIDPVTEYVKNLAPESRKKMRSYFGSGATEKVLMEFHNAIHNDFSEYNPEGLEQWRKESTGQYTDLATSVGNKEIQPLIDKAIKQIISSEYGMKQWWIEGIPLKVRLDCVRRKEEDNSAEEPWNFLDTIHYKEIISTQWSILGELFTPPKMEQASKKKKLTWLDKLNSIRKKYSHPQREKVTEDEYNELVEMHKWLVMRLSE